jgi:DNA-directed RNA polymerase subunit RPC12/RpoP
MAFERTEPEARRLIDIEEEALQKGARCMHCSFRFTLNCIRLGEHSYGIRRFVEHNFHRAWNTVYFKCSRCRKETLLEHALPEQKLLAGPGLKDPEHTQLFARLGLSPTRSPDGNVWTLERKALPSLGAK